MNLPLGYRRLLLLALCLPFFLAHITPVLMKEDCDEGSEDSCQNFMRASECGEGEHCQRTFGSRTTMKSIACEACINLMTFIDNFVEIGPKEKCGYIGVCDTEIEMPLQTMMPAHVAASTMIPAQEPVKKDLIQMKGELPCHLCHYIIQEIIKLLEGNKTREAVMNRLENVCTVIPKYLAGSCRDLLESYGQNIFHLLLEMTKPDSLCSILDVCHSKSPAHAAKKAQSNTLCELCKMFDGYLDQILAKNSTQNMILHAFQKACSKFPGVYKEKCDEFVKEYEPLLIGALHDEMDPNSLCPKIGICPEASPKSLLLETKQCVQGPSYWCKNMETATQCNAVELCENHEWN
ncbi:prosaposin-like [Macrotis lagotis]|uniref:prosaposin-like n=1 Tax=Macrotis lagotis TaxID=92651 RepID=UPI003D68612B